MVIWLKVLQGKCRLDKVAAIECFQVNGIVFCLVY